ncbi:aminopeptidase N-like isoform X2 [Diprion similis]|uniref:aminopeptidase N-like isoform X2 n=1 Tax=Diprion similis TaxID=362088 RepID=UPI001EF88E7A|nr:aminopeptidase N-like isoform X2 [Diprion similis]
MMMSLDTIPDYYNLFKNSHNASANMAQIAGSRSEFTTSDLGLSDTECKQKGGCFLSYKKSALIILMFIIGVITAGFIGAYSSPWVKKPTVTALTLPEEDDVEGIRPSARFSVSPLISPTLYEVELIPVMEQGVTKLNGHLVVEFAYNGNRPLSKIVLNAKEITVLQARLFSTDDPLPANAHFRRRRDVTDENVINPEAKSTSESTNQGSGMTPEDSGLDDTSSWTSVNLPSILTAESSSEKVVDDETPDPISITSPDVITTSNNTYSEKDKATLPASSSELPVVIQKISPPSITTRPIVSSSTFQSPSTSSPKRSTEIGIANDEMDAVDGFYVIYPNDPIQRGIYSIEITYEAKVDGQAVFNITYNLEDQNRWLLATNLKQFGTGTLFPGFEDPKDKAIFSLSIAKLTNVHTLTNMPLVSSSAISNDLMMDHFQTSPPLSSHNLAFAITNLQPISEPTLQNLEIPLTLWIRSREVGQTRFIFETIGRVAQNLSHFFSVPYPLPKLDVATLPGLDGDGISSPGLIFIRESMLSLDQESSAITKELKVQNLIRLIGEQWLGGLVSTQTRMDAWFLESSLFYLQYLLADKIDPTLDSFNSIGILQHSAFEADAYDVSRSMKSKLKFPASQTTYEKGACLIRMLNYVISDSGFRNGYKTFLTRWANANADVSDFLASMSKEAQWLPDDVSFAQVFASWIDQGGFPVVTVTRNYESASATVRQEQFAFDNETITNRKLWHVPVSYIVDGDDWSSPSRTWLSQEETTLMGLGNNEEKRWLLLNVNQTGYYRVNYDLDNWSLLASALDSKFDIFPVTTRTSLVDDALSLAWAGRLAYPTALNLIQFLHKRETHHSPWTVAFQNMEKLNYLLQNTVAYSSFQEFMVKFISPLFNTVTASNTETQLKLITVKWACLVDNPKCQSYMKNLSSVPNYLEKTHHCTLARFGGKQEWDFLISKISAASNKETKLKLLSALPCFQVEWILQILLNDIMTEGKMDEHETLELLRSFRQNPIAARSAFKFFRIQWNEIFKRFSKSYSILKAFVEASVSGITDEQDLKDFQIFKEKHFDSLKFLGHTIRVAETEARSRISWLKKNLITVQRWLDVYIRPTI